MIQKAWSSIEDVPYCFARSSIECQGCTALKFFEFDPNWPFPDCNSSLNSPMAMKYCTKLETARERWPIVFQGHPSNFKVTRDKTSPILTQIVCFRTIGRSQLSNPSDLPCYSRKCVWECCVKNSGHFVSASSAGPVCMCVANLVIAVPADVLKPNGAKSSVGTKLLMFPPRFL